MEKVSILALSFILTTSFSISSAQSAMFAYYKGIPHSMIELLVSLPSAGIMVSLIFNKWIGRLFSRASDDCDRLSCLRSMWLYSLNQSSLIRLSFCLGLFSGWQLVCSMFLPLPLSVSAIKEKNASKPLAFVVLQRLLGQLF